MLKDFEIKKASSVVVQLFFYYIKQIDSMLLCVSLVIDHRRRQSMARISMTHSATFLFLPHFDVICDLLLNRRLATWNPFVTEKTLNCPWVSNFPSFSTYL